MYVTALAHEYEEAAVVVSDMVNNDSHVLLLAAFIAKRGMLAIKVETPTRQITSREEVEDIITQLTGQLE